MKGGSQICWKRLQLRVGSGRKEEEAEGGYTGGGEHAQVSHSFEKTS